MVGADRSALMLATLWLHPGWGLVARNASGQIKVVVPVKDGPAYGLLDEFGFVGREDRLRMELGEAPHAEGLQTYGTTPYLAT
jgi:hypothetical protein